MTSCPTVVLLADLILSMTESPIGTLLWSEFSVEAISCCWGGDTEDVSAIIRTDSGVRGCSWAGSVCRAAVPV